MQMQQMAMPAMQMNMMQESAFASEDMLMERSSAAPKRDRATKSSTNTVGGKKKLNDKTSASLFKMSKY